LHVARKHVARTGRTIRTSDDSQEANAPSGTLAITKLDVLELTESRNSRILMLQQARSLGRRHEQA
jgi:hypothetical protein